MSAFFDRPDWDNEIPSRRYHNYDPHTSANASFVTFVLSVVLFGLALILRTLNGASLPYDVALFTLTAGLIHWGLLAIGSAVNMHLISDARENGTVMSLDADDMYFPVNLLSFSLGLAVEVAAFIVPLAIHPLADVNLTQGLIPFWTFLVCAGVFGLSLAVKCSYRRRGGGSNPIVAVANLVILVVAGIAEILLAAVALLGGTTSLPLVITGAIVMFLTTLYFAYDINHIK